MNIMGLFDAFDRASVVIGLRQQIRDKTEQLNSVTAKRCGNCRLWMTSYCTPEKVGKQFKSMNSEACDLLEMSPSSRELRDALSVELDALRQKLLTTQPQPASEL